MGDGRMTAVLPLQGGRRNSRGSRRTGWRPGSWSNGSRWSCSREEEALGGRYTRVVRQVCLKSEGHPTRPRTGIVSSRRRHGGRLLAEGTIAATGGRTMTLLRRQFLQTVGGGAVASVAMADDMPAKTPIKVGQIGVGHGHATKLSV